MLSPSKMSRFLDPKIEKETELLKNTRAHYEVGGANAKNQHIDELRVNLKNTIYKTGLLPNFIGWYIKT